MKRMMILAVLFLQATMLFAQQGQQMPPVPLDPAVKTGTLPNGLTYYIRHNEWPEKRVDFYIAQKVGSVLEEENQRGLAHFLEHMCFNGTTHFPGDNLKQYLERIGVKFGENLNAYTAFDQTVYNINNVNKDVPGAIDSCLMILHDWSHDLLLEDAEIDKERGVINEEWRMRRSAMMRMQEEAFKDLYAGSRYAERMPIGTMDVVMNFAYDDLRDYYRRWYRPDLQGIIVVGDVNVEEIESKIKAVFADIEPASSDAAERIMFPVPDNDTPIVSIQKDKEQTVPVAFFFIKTDAMSREEKGSMAGLLGNYIEDAVSHIMAERLQDISRRPDAPFLMCQIGFDNYLVAKSKDALQALIIPKEGLTVEGIAAAYREVLRARRGGFTQGEYDRFKTEYLSKLEAAYNARDKVENKTYAERYVSHFLDNEPTPGIEAEYMMMQQLVPAIPVEAVNMAMAEIPDNNRAVALFMPDKEGMDYPTREEILKALEAVDGESIDAVAEEINNDPLVPKIKSKVKVKSITDDLYGSKLITLSNGIRIHVLQTDYSPNRIQLRASSWGGASLYPENLHTCVTLATLVDEGGWGTFSASQLEKRLSGIQAKVNINIDSRSESLEGNCVKKDFESLLQLVYLHFTAPHRDDEAYQSTLEQLRQMLANQGLNPQTALQDSLIRVLYNNHPRAMRLTAADVDKLDYDVILKIYRERFANAADFEFYLVGDISAEEAAPLLAEYIGALPAKGKSESYQNTGLVYTRGEETCIFEKEQNTPNAVVIFHYYAPMEYTLRNSILISMLEQTLQMLFTETVREEEGGAYGVPAMGILSDYPESVASVMIQLPTAPEKRERMTEVIRQGLEKLCAEGPSEEYLQKIKEYMLRSHAENLKNNDFWLEALYNRTRLNFESVDGYESIVESVTSDDLRQTAAKIFHSGNRKEVGMTTAK